SVSSPWGRCLLRASGVAAVGRLGAALHRPQALERARHDGRNRLQPEASLALPALKRPGVTRTFTGPQSGGRMNASSNHQAEKSGKNKGTPIQIVSDEMLIILPLPCCFMVGTTALQQSHIPLTFTATTRSPSAPGICSKGVSFKPP